MDTKKIVFHETLIVAAGELLGSALMVCLFALLGKYDISVLLGSIVGTLLAIGNFFFMAVGTSLAADKAEQQDVKGGQLLIRNSYTLRMILLFVILFACAKSGIFNVFSLVLPLIFVRPTLTIAEFFRKKGDT